MKIAHNMYIEAGRLFAIFIRIISLKGLYYFAFTSIEPFGIHTKRKGIICTSLCSNTLYQKERHYVGAKHILPGTCACVSVPEKGERTRARISTRRRPHGCASPWRLRRRAVLGLQWGSLVFQGRSAIICIVLKSGPRWTIFSDESRRQLHPGHGCASLGGLYLRQA